MWANVGKYAGRWVSLPNSLLHVSALSTLVSLKLEEESEDWIDFLCRKIWAHAPKTNSCPLNDQSDCDFIMRAS